MNSAAAPSPERQSTALGRSLIKYAVMALILAGVLWLTSGRSDWMRAWVYVGLTVAAQAVVGILIHRRNPDLLAERSRIQGGTKSFDKVLAPIVGIVGPVALWVVAGLDVRAHWPPPVPLSWSIAGYAICSAGIALTAWAMLNNRFFSATVRLQRERGHAVIDRGPYAYVRHPGYTGALAFTLASPIALGSRAALWPAAITVVALVIRTALEDRVLRSELEGYANYAGRVRSRLLPGLW